MMAYTHKLIRFLHYLRIENLHNILPHIPVYFQTGKGSKYILLLENGRHHSSKMWYCRRYNIIMLQHLDAWGFPYKSSLICQLWCDITNPLFASIFQNSDFLIQSLCIKHLLVCFIFTCGNFDHCLFADTAKSIFRY